MRSWTLRRTTFCSVMLRVRTTFHSRRSPPGLWLEKLAVVMIANLERPVPVVNLCWSAAATTPKEAMAYTSLQTVAPASPPLGRLQELGVVGTSHAPPCLSPAAKGAARSSWIMPMCLLFVHQEHHPRVSAGPRGRSAQSVVEMQCSSQRVTNAPDSSLQAQADAEVQAAVQAPRLQPSVHQQRRSEQ